MSSTTPRDAGPPPDSPSDVRPLPARPNLEFERKQAKKLLAQLHQSDPDALVRVHAKMKRSADTKPDEFQLSDAQFTIAREYGFTSWPRLVEYFETLARHEVNLDARPMGSTASLESWARTIQSDHREKRAWTAQYLAAYVPRFHGRSVEQVLGGELTIDDAKLATARMYRYPSWEVMISDLRPSDNDSWVFHDSPVIKAIRASVAENLAELERLVAEHPEFLADSPLAHDVILREIKEPSERSRRAYDWLAARMDLQPTLNRMLLGYMRMKPAQMQRLLDLGADPHWTPPNGLPVLEHVMVRAWSGGVVDLVAQRVNSRPRFWISAGLGHADEVARYFDANGALTDEARNNRPDFTALGFPMPQNPAADDEVIIWEAFLIAAFNDRLSVLDVLLDRGFPIDYIGWGQPVLHFAVSEGRVELLEYLIKRGANLDLKGWRPHLSARELAEQNFLNPHSLPNAARILELCGGRDPEVLRREREERRAQRVMQTAPHVERAFNYAKQNASAKGLTSVDQESLFIGLLREAGMTVAILADSGVDLAQLRAVLADRLNPVAVDVPAEMTANPDVSAILMDARTTAEQRKHDILAPVHVFHALIQRASRPVLEIIETAGGSKEKLLPKIERTLNDW